MNTPKSSTFFGKKEHIGWTRNTPTASHMCGYGSNNCKSYGWSMVATNKIRRKYLSSQVQTHGISLTTELLSDNNSLNPICPSKILTMKIKVMMPALGEFGHSDICCHKQWR